MRKGLGLVAWTAMALWAACLPAAAEETRVAGAAFTVPDGWTPRAGASPNTWQGERHLGRGVGLIQIMPNVRGASFDAAFDQMAALVPELRQERPQFKGSGVRASGERIRYESRCCGSRNGVTLGTQVVGISDGSRHAFLMLVDMNLHGDARPAAHAEFDTLVRSFHAEGADPVAFGPGEGAGGLDGVFTHLDNGLVPNAFGGIDFRSENRVRAFDPGGFFANDVPPGGTSVRDHCATTPKVCGTYRLLPGDRIELRTMTRWYGLIDTSEAAFARDGDGFKIDSQSWRPVPPLAAGTRFDGTWQSVFASSGTTIAGSNSIAVEHTLSMSRDGRFRRTGFTGLSSSVEGAEGRTGVTVGRDRPIEAGRYEAEGHRLLLRGDDGRQESLSLILPDAGSDGLLVINGGNYLKQKN